MRRRTNLNILILSLLIVWLSVSGTIAILPPSKQEIESRSFESLKEYRQRLGIDFQYRTRYLHPEFCRTLSEEECQRIDETEGENAKRNRLFLTSKGREHIRRNLQEQHPFRFGVKTTSGTLKVLVCLLVWSDHEGQRELPPAGDYERLLNADDIDETLYPAGSINRWFETSSYGDFSIEATVVEWAVTDNTEAYYSQPNRGRTEALVPALDHLLERMGAQGFDFSPFDLDGDQVIDMTVFIHSGYDGANFGVDQFGASQENRIAAHARSGVTASTWMSPEGYVLGPYAVASGYVGINNFETARMGIILHEMLHTFGLPDLYDLENDFGQGTLGGVGSFDIMSSPSGQSDR